MIPSFKRLIFTFLFLCPHLLVLADSNLKSCLKAAVGGDSSRVAFPDLFFDFLHVKRYNLYYNVKPAAVAYPLNATEVGALVKCGAQNNVKIQARSGGHSFGDYCERLH
jgi:FAD/FMN-containing dehydrogenase